MIPSIRGFKRAERLAPYVTAGRRVRAAAIPLVGEVVEYPRHGRGRRWRPSFVSMACAASPWSAPQPSIKRLILRGNNYLGSDLYQRRYQHFRRLPNVSPRGR